MYNLTKHEELILISIWKLKNNSYGVTIRSDFAKSSGKTINYGSLCHTFYRLVQKGLIISEESEPTSRQGGRRKVQYFLTDEGKKALKDVYGKQRFAWNSIADFLTEAEGKSE